MARNDVYEYVDEESINQSLKCNICNQPFVRPVSTNCWKKHKFCRRCIEQWLQHNTTCPMCRQHLRPEDLVSITEDIVVDVLNELRVRCTGCGQTNLERGNFNEHLKHSCSSRTVSCPAHDVRCPWTGHRDQLDHHLRKCPFQSLRPFIGPLLNENHQLKEQMTQLTRDMEECQREVQQLNKLLAQQAMKMSTQYNEMAHLHQLWKRNVPPLPSRSVIPSK